jgi:hypothetical protein
MANYRLPQVDLSTRIDLANMMMNPARSQGQISQLAKEHAVSRKFLYQLQTKAEIALSIGLEAQWPGPKRASQQITVDDNYLKQVITTLSMLPPSIRNLQLAMEWLFKAHVSLGAIEKTLQQVGKRADTENQCLRPPRPVQGEVDEIYEKDQPCLTVIDHQSALLLNLGQAENCDSLTWGVTLLDLQQQGIEFEDLASDGSSSIQTGIGEAQPGKPYRPDWFHLLQKGHMISGRLEEQAYAALSVAEKARRAEQEAQAAKRRKGRPLKSGLSYAETAPVADQASYLYDAWSWLFRELRHTCQLTQPSGRLFQLEPLRQSLAAILDLMVSLQVPAITTFANHLLELRDLILAPFVSLEQALAPWRSRLPIELETFLLWAWSQRASFNFQIQRDLPLAVQPVAQAVWDALTQFHRTSCMAECVHSWVRPFFVLHRGIPEWLLPLLQGYWNHHIFQRGVRRGFSPLALAKIPAFSDPFSWLKQLLLPPV